MSQNFFDTLSFATKVAIGIFVVAFFCLWLLGSYSFFLSVLLAAIIGVIVWLAMHFWFADSLGGRVAESADGSSSQSGPDMNAAAEAKPEPKPEPAATSTMEKPAASPEPVAAPEPVATPEPAPMAAPEPEPVAAAQNMAEDYDRDGVLEGKNEGTRPAGLDAPRDGKADDLKQIKGIGAKMEALCNRLGFWHFDQIAAWTTDEVAWVDANLEGFKGRVTRDTWVEQAGILASGGGTEFSKRVEDGDVY